MSKFESRTQKYKYSLIINKNLVISVNNVYAKLNLVKELYLERILKTEFVTRF
jgi:hypothetical protein